MKQYMLRALRYLNTTSLAYNLIQDQNILLQRHHQYIAYVKFLKLKNEVKVDL